MSDVRHNNKDRIKLDYKNNKVRLHANLSPRIKYSKSLETYDVTKSIRQSEARIEFCSLC